MAVVQVDFLNSAGLVFQGRNNRLALTASDGTTLVVWSDNNGTVDDQVHVGRLSGSGKGTYTHLASFNAPGSDLKGGMTAALFPDDSVAILVKSEDRQSLRYVKVRSSDWTDLGWEVVNNHSGSFMAESMDIDVSDNNKVFVCWNQSGPDNIHSRIKMRDGAGTWINVRDAVITDGPQRRSCNAASIVTLGFGTGTVRNVVFAHGAGKAGVDFGILLYTCGIDEADGSITEPVTQRLTLMGGEADPANTGNPEHRNVKLFRGDGNEFLLAALHRTVNKKIGAMKASYHNGAWAVINQLATANLQYTPSGNNSAITCRHDTVDADSHTVNFYTGGKIDDTNETPFDTIAKVSDDGITFSPYFKYGIPPKNRFTTHYVRYMNGGGSRNLHLGLHEISIQYGGTLSSGGAGLVADWTFLGYGKLQPVGATSIVLTVPAHEAVASSANPDLSVTVHDGQKFAAMRQKVQWQFATDPAFGGGDIVANYTQADNKLVKIEGTDVSGVNVVINDKLPNTFSLTGGTYYMRARMIDEWGNSGVWTSTRTVYVIHPPTAVAVSPTNGVYLNYGTGDVTFQWEVTDPSPTDFQTARQLQLYTNEGAIIFDTGKDVTEETSFTENVDEAYKNQQLYWIVKPWDTNDTPGAFSEQAFFTLADPPSATIIEPDPGETVETGMPDLIANMVTSGGRKIKQVIFSITKGGQPIWSLKKVGTWDNGDDVTTQVPQNFLQNHTTYSLQVQVLDSGGLTGLSSIHQFTVEWTPPDAPTAVTADASAYPLEIVDDEPGGYVKLTWTESEDDDFYSWNVYRKDDLIDPDTLVVIEEGSWRLVHREYEIGASYEFRDYFAPSGYKVTYRLEQQINLNGQDIESEDGPTDVVYPDSDGYWLIMDSNIEEDVEIFKFNVNSDDFTEEQEEAEFIVIGRGRAVNRGQNLGPKGSMTSKIRNSPGRTARQKRLLLLEAQQTHRKVWLRNPFGDVFRVSVSQMAVSRIAGVGKAEFVDVTIPYAKVGK